MDHVAIMYKRGGLIEKILSGEKRIESRWYKNKVLPIGKISKGDKIYFKYSGKPVTAVAWVERVELFDNLNLDKTRTIVEKYGGKGGIDLVDGDKYSEWSRGKNYCILIWLGEPRKTMPFYINKKGFGSAAAWMCTENIEDLRLDEIG